MKPSLALAIIMGVLCLFPSCKNGPRVRVFISDPANGGMEYYDENTGEKGFTPYTDTDKYIALTPADAQILFNYCGAAKKN